VLVHYFWLIQQSDQTSYTYPEMNAETDTVMSARWDTRWSAVAAASAREVRAGQRTQRV